jgi:two-component system catabolic regulation response regulator CreB
MERKTILLVEDEPSIADNIVYALSTEGFDPVHCATGHAALEALAAGAPSLVILDLGLPDVGGFDLLREIRRTSSVPLIVVTSRAEEVDRIVGLEIGADDYVVKPVSPRELTARVRAILRRVPGNGIPPSRGDGKKPIPFELDDVRCVIRYHGETLDLSRYEFRLLGTLVRNPGRVYTREQLLGRISEEPEMSLDRTIDTHIKTLRQKLKSIRPDDNPILTHRGLGYSLAESG